MERIDHFKWAYEKAYGNRKYLKIESKINSSEKIQKLLNISRDKKLAPAAADFVYAINEIPFFIFSSSDTLALGVLLFIERWIKEVNDQLYLLNNFEIDRIITAVMRGNLIKGISIAV